MIDVNDRVPLYPGRVKMTPVSGQANVYDMVRADQPQKGGTPLNRNTFRKTQADIRAYPIATGNSVAAGDVVDVVNGEVTRSVVAEANVKTILQGLNVSRLDVCMLTDTVGVAAYGATNSQCRSFKVDGAKITPVGIDSFYNGPINGVSLARLSDTKIVVSWSISSQIYTRLATIVESSISFKNTVQPTGNNSDYPYIVALDTDRFAIFYSSVGANSIAVNVGTVSGDTITYPGNGYSKSGCDPKNISAALLPNDSSGNKRVCVCFVDVNDNKGKAVIATINSSNAVTWGSVVTFNAGPIYNRPDCCLYNSETVVVAYAQSGTGALATSLLVSGSSISVGDTSDSLTNSGNDMAVENVGEKIVVVTTDHNIKGAAYLLSLDNNFSLLDSFTFNSLVATAPSIGKIDNYRFVLAFGDSSNSNYLTSTILEVNGNQIAGGFTVNSTQAIALQSGEAGQEIEVIFAGTTAADFATEGQAIPSDGVYGYGPMAGWLNVIPYWAKEAGVRIATGSYVGTGTYGASNPNSLTFDFAPNLVIVICDIGILNTSYSTYPVQLIAFMLRDANNYSVFRTTNSNSSMSSTTSFAGVLDTSAGTTFVWHNGQIGNSYAQALEQLNEIKTYRYIAIG